MRICQSIFLAFVTFVSFSVSAGSVGTIPAEKAKLLKRIQCHHQANTPPGDGLGSLWGCYNQAEDVKLWINGEASKRDAVRNIKLAVVNWHERKMDITGRIWSGILAEEYAGQEAEAVKATFQKCPVKETYNIEGKEIFIKCSKGPKADEHLLIVYPK